MSKNRFFVAIGEEMIRGMAESSTVGIVPVLSPAIMDYQPDDVKRNEFRGERASLGHTLTRRMSRKWSGSLEVPGFTEAGIVEGMIGTIFKHFFGRVNSAQNGTTGQYRHLFYPEVAPFSPGQPLEAKALTINQNMTEGAMIINHVFAGGRVKAITFTKEAGQPLKITFEFFGQTWASGAAITTPLEASFPAENLRLDYNNLSLYTGTITKTGTAPDYTDFTFASATLIKPDKITLKLTNPFTDKVRIAGVDYPDKTVFSGSRWGAALDFTVDFEDPASGFNCIDEKNAFLTDIAENNFFLEFDTDTQAGTGDNHSLLIDLPRMNNKGGKPEFSLENDPIVSFSYESMMDDEGDKYPFAVMLKNTATSV